MVLHSILLSSHWITLKHTYFEKKTLIFIVSYGVTKITRFIKKRRKRKEEVISLEHSTVIKLQINNKYCLIASRGLGFSHGL
jgi:phosphate starvation-inducible membrane PsiE